MNDDPIMNELHRAKERLSLRFNGDFKNLARYYAQAPLWTVRRIATVPKSNHGSPSSSNASHPLPR